MLPGYISYYLGTDTSVEKALPAGLTCVLGLLAVFSIIGFAVSALGNIVTRYIPSLELAAGLLAILMGIIVLARINILSFLHAPSIVRAPKRRGFVGLFLYGFVYGLATFGCSAPILFSMIVYAMSTGGLFSGAIVFIVYALGMGIPVMITTVFVAKAKKIALKRMVRSTDRFQKISGIILILIGIYIIYYYTTFLR
jgi:cytochrome c-type biogenesis protein